jgi:hypothetical protein
VVQELLQVDEERYVQFCAWHQQLMLPYHGVLDLTWFIDETWFDFSDATQVCGPPNVHVQTMSEN